jgi:hypothetical protein
MILHSISLLILLCYLHINHSSNAINLRLQVPVIIAHKGKGLRRTENEYPEGD